jgi:CheY-like chemotaxis protein
MGLRVLIAEDDPTTLAAVAQAMGVLGYDVSRAEDGDELLQQMSEHGPFDLVVTDVSMPWMTGLQVAHSARAAGVETPIIVMTALAVIPSSVATLGPNALLLRKPFGLKRLQECVDQLVASPTRADAAR